MKLDAYNVGRRDVGRTLGAVVKAWTGRSWSQVRTEIAAGRFGVNGRVCTDFTRRMRLKELVAEVPRSRLKARRDRAIPASAAPRKPTPDASGIVIVYSDDDVLVVDKPPGLTTMRHATEAAEFGTRGRRYLPPTLADRLHQLVPGEIRAVHRIDRDTSGLVVFGRNAAAERDLGRQLRAHTVARRYVALVRGTPAAGRIESWIVRDRGDGRRGSSADRTGQRAVTHVRVLESLEAYSLVECRLETGRTHQIRIHLGEAGTPLAGETIYDRPIHGSPAPDGSGVPRLALHAASIGFVHPRTKKWMEWSSELPRDIQSAWRRLRERNRVE